jgi:hypoxanthine phosphoribosyltransferase
VTFRPLYKPDQIARRMRELGRQISRDYRDQPVDLVCILDNAFMFVADLVRHIQSPVRCHFVRAESRDVRDPLGYERKEIFYTPEINATGKHILLAEGVLQSGITIEFLIKRIGLSGPRSIKTVVLVDKPAERKVALEPDYYGFRVASNEVVVGYGLAWDGFYRNLPYIAVPAGGRVARPRAHRARGRRSARRKARR